MMVGMLPIVSSEQDQFLRMVAKELSERKPSFVPQDERKRLTNTPLRGRVTMLSGRMGEEQKVSAPKRRTRTEGQLLVAEFASSGSRGPSFVGVGI
jgi:hypothetical protein